MEWVVEIGDEFDPELDALHEEVQTEILALSRLLQLFGPQLGRPRVDTLNGSRHANMKELRFSAADGEWREAFAFDTERKAILLVAGDKSGGGERRFYRGLIRKADERFDAHLTRLKNNDGGPIMPVNVDEKIQKAGRLTTQKGRGAGGGVDSRGDDPARSQKGAGVDAGAHGGATRHHAGRRIEASKSEATSCSPR